MDTIVIIILLICCCCLSSISSAGGLFYKPKFRVIGGGMNISLQGDKKLLECSDNAFITDIYGKYKDGNINYLGIKCSDDDSPKPVGIDVGSSFSNVSNEGYNKIIIKRDDVNSVRVRPAEDRGKEIKPKKESYVLKYMKWFPIKGEEGDVGTSDNFYQEDSALCRKHEKLTSISMLLNDSKGISGLGEWGCGTNASLFERMFG
jgi:hypothetical protein